MRQIPPALAPVLEELELHQPLLVNRDDVAAVCAAVSPTASVDYVIHRLLTEGWLLPLTTRGVWEFAPAARAGPIGRGDPLIEARAALHRRPDLGIAIAAESAAWLLGLSSREPGREAIGAAKGTRIPPALKEYRIVRHVPRLEPEDVGGLPTWRVESLLTAMSIRPTTYRDWPNVRDWLPRAFERSATDALAAELEATPRAAWARLAYLARAAEHLQLGAYFLDRAPSGKGPFHLGPRDRSGKYDKPSEVVDSLLVTTKR